MKNLLVWVLIIGSVAVTVFIVSARGQRETVTLNVRESAIQAGEEETGPGAEEERTFEIVTLLPKDAIPAVYRPQLIGVDEANLQYNDTDLVIGVEIDGDARAYNIPFLSRHEIVNDTVGGRKIAVTW